MQPQQGNQRHQSKIGFKSGLRVNHDALSWMKKLKLAGKR
jgi:hypothetical protein